MTRLGQKQPRPIRRTGTKDPRSERWKSLERNTAKKLKGHRLLRGDNWDKIAPDVAVPDCPELKIDCKAYNRFAHHTLMDEIRSKYCAEEWEVPVLVTKAQGQHGEYVTMPLDYFAALLEYWRGKTHENLPKMPVLEPGAGE